MSLSDLIVLMPWERLLILCLEFAGRVKEYGSPSSLLDDSHSEFSSLVREYSARSVSYVDLGSLDSPSS